MPFDVTLSDPFGCTGPGDTLNVEASFTNNGAAAIAAVTFQASLPAQLAGLPGSCTVSDGTSVDCTVTANSVSWTGNWPGAPSTPANTITINYQVAVAPGLPPGTALCIDSTLSFNSGGPQTIDVTACGQVTCPLDPTAVRLAYFRAIPAGGEVRLVWQTESELDVLGFDILRSSSPDGPFTRVNPALIPATGSANRGAAYVLRDRPGNGTFHYRLEDVSGGGKRTQHTREMVRLGPDAASNVLYLPTLSGRRANQSALMRLLQTAIIRRLSE